MKMIAATRLAWAVPVLLAALATAAAEPTAGLPRVRRLVADHKPVRVVVYGDSISEVKQGWNGGAKSREANWAAVLVKRLGELHPGSTFSIEHFAIGGQNTADGLERLDGLAPLAPDLVLVAFGANDCCHRFLEPAETKQALLTLCREIKQRHGADVVVVGTGGDNPLQPFFRHLDETLAAQRAAAAEAGVPFVDVRPAILAATEGGKRWAEFHFNPGNCHPTDKGHEVWAAAALALIRQAVPDAEQPMPAGAAEAAAAAGRTPDIGELSWVGDLDLGSPTLGLPGLAGVQTVTLFQGTPAAGSYSHHGYIFVHEGTVYATWSNHLRDEDAPGQRVLGSRSADGGQTWEPWAEIFPPQDRMKPASEQDEKQDRVLIANGFAVVDGDLYAVAEAHVLDGRRGLGRLARKLSPTGHPGPIFWLTPAPPDPLPGVASSPGSADAEYAGVAEKISQFLARPEHLPSWEFTHQTCSPRAADGHQLCEPTQGWRLPEGPWVRLLRDLAEPRARKNYVQFSLDDGQTWTPARPTNFPDACSRSAAGVLPDGTVYVVNNPGSGRDPLVISLADDGLRFDRHAVIRAGAPPVRHEGRWKGPGFQYPRAAVCGHALLVIYSIGKEDMAVSRIPLAALESIPAQSSGRRAP
jgi:lysophospholipase L1-like esterase